MKATFEPKTLQEVILYFADEKRAFEYIRARRWPDGTYCPRCNSKKVHFIESRLIWRCNGCRKQFSVKVGTIFEDSPIKLSKWIPAMWLIANAKNGISSYELHRGLGVTQKTAWFMLHRIRLALQDGTLERLGGKDTEVEVDETYVGGKGKNMHAKVKAKRFKTARSKSTAKSVVFGMLERKGRVRSFHVFSSTRRQLFPRLYANVHPESTVYTDSAVVYFGLGRDFNKHAFVDHTIEYVQGQVHTNTLENYWSLLKRTIKGTYVSVEPIHLFRYLDEQSFRYNARKGTDADRFYSAVSGAFGRRLTYNDLTGKGIPVA